MRIRWNKLCCDEEGLTKKQWNKKSFKSTKMLSKKQVPLAMILQNETK